MTPQRALSLTPEVQAQLNFWPVHDAFTWIDHHVSKQVAVKTEKRGKVIATDFNRVIDYPFVIVNKYRYTLVHVDVDDFDPQIDPNYKPGFDPETYNEHDIPLPNFVVSTTGSNYQAFWLLRDPLPKKNISPASLDFYHDVRTKLLYKLNGDFSCNISGAVRNPFYKKGKVLKFTDQRTDLNTLNTDFPLEWKLPPKTLEHNRREYMLGNRNRATFEYVLRQYYAGVDTVEGLLVLANKYQALAPTIAPLNYMENWGIVRSVLRNGPRYKVRADRNYGAMNLPPVPWHTMTAAERVETISQRQREGARYTNQKRKETTFDRLDATVQSMKIEGKEITKKGLAKEAKASILTVKRHWDNLTR